MNIENLTNDELRELIRTIIREVLVEKKQPKQKISAKHYSNQGSFTSQTHLSQSNEMENLIGSIPFILLDKNIFEKNMDVVEFAAKIGIIITSGEKKKLDEIVGRIIVAIKEFPPSRVAQLNQAISQLKSKTATLPKKDKKSFFEAWDRVIKNM